MACSEWNVPCVYAHQFKRYAALVFLFGNTEGIAHHTEQETHRERGEEGDRCSPYPSRSPHSLHFEKSCSSSSRGEIDRTCLPVKPWQMTRVSLLIQTLADADMARAWLAIALTGAARTNMMLSLCCADGELVLLCVSRLRVRWWSVCPLPPQTGLQNCNYSHVDVSSRSLLCYVNTTCYLTHKYKVIVTMMPENDKEPSWCSFAALAERPYTHSPSCLHACPHLHASACSLELTHWPS